MKLSKAQESVIKEAREKIDIARVSFPEFVRFINSYYEGKTDEEIINGLENDKRWWNPYESYKKSWEEAKNGIVLTSCNSRTLYKLEDMGLIEIIEDSTGTHHGIDKIKVLNY